MVDDQEEETLIMRGLLLLYCVVLVTVVGATPLPRMSAAVRLARGSKRVGRGGRRGFQVCEKRVHIFGV